MAKAKDLRLCRVDDEFGYFHCFEQWSNVVDASPLDLNALKEFPDASFDATDIPDYVASITPKLSTSVEFTMEAEINGDLLAELFGFPMARGKNFTVEYSEPILIQARRHHKKRIDKKWRKRYGYKTIFRKKRLTDCVVRCEGFGDELDITVRKLFGV